MYFKQIAAASLFALVGTASAGGPIVLPPGGGYGGGVPAAAVGPSSAPAAPAPSSSMSTMPTMMPVGTPAAPGTPAVTGQVHTVWVGNGNFTFAPRNVQAAPGDRIDFIWNGTIPHSVSQSTKAELCSMKAAGFDSGVKAVNNNTFSIMVNDTAPLWFYCAVPNHCMGKMMYGAVNFPTNATFPTPAAAPSGSMASGMPMPTDGASANATKTSNAASLSVMSGSVVLAGSLALGALLL